MPKYLVQFRYTAEGSKGVLKDGGTKRRAAVEKGIQSVGGTLESFYFSFGKYDGLLIADLPDAAAAAAVSLSVSGSGAAANLTTVLLTPQEIDQAARKKVTYKKPGQ